MTQKTDLRATLPKTHLAQRIKNMLPEELAWVIPSALVVTEDHLCWLQPEYNFVKTIPRMNHDHTLPGEVNVNAEAMRRGDLLIQRGEKGYKVWTYFALKNGQRWNPEGFREGRYLLIVTHVQEEDPSFEYL